MFFFSNKFYREFTFLKFLIFFESNDYQKQVYGLGKFKGADT